MQSKYWSKKRLFQVSEMRRFVSSLSKKSYSLTKNACQMEMKTMAQTMVPGITPANAHKDIPGNPSTAKSSKVRLNDRSNGKPLQLLSEADWKFWIENGYIVIKNAVPKDQVERTANFLWEFEEKDAANPETWY